MARTQPGHSPATPTPSHHLHPLARTRAESNRAGAATQVPRDRRLNVPSGVTGGLWLWGQGQRLHIWPSLPCWEPTSASPLPTCKEGNCKSCPFCSQLESFLSQKCAALSPMGQRNPPSPGNACGRPWPLPCTPACSHRCWG